MERKIGEVFEHDGEWYQCIKQPEKYNKTVCNLCDFHGIGNCEFDRCSGTYRSDGKPVIYKKLEKIGEPFSDEHFGLVQKYELKMYGYSTKDKRVRRADGYDVFIKIKQNKEDMEENKLNLKPFNLEEAKAGKPVCTRDGMKARIICFDKKAGRPIVVLVEGGDGNGEYVIFCDDGGYYNCKEMPDCSDLMMLPEKKEGWVNVYQGGKLDADYIYPTKADAVENIFQPMKDKYIDTIKLTWEE